MLGAVRAVTCFGLLAVALPLAGQSDGRDAAVQFRVGGNIDIDSAGREQVVIVARGDAHVRGSVDVLVVVDGNALLDGGRVHDLTVVRGRLDLRSGAVVTGDAHLVESALTIEPGSHVDGEVEQGPGIRFARDLLAVVMLVGLGTLLACVLVGAFVARLAPASLARAASAMRAEPARVLAAGTIVWLVLPLVAAMLIPSMIGLPLGLAYLVVVIPGLLFTGLVVSGSWLGDVLIRQVRRQDRPTSPPIAAALGITTLLLLARIPVAGVLVFASILYGAGAAVLLASRAAGPALGMSRTGQSP